MSDYLIHHGIKGMRWGIRKYQNEDGSLTPAGKQRYGSAYDRRNAKAEARIAKANAKVESSKTGFMKRHYIRKAENIAYANDRKNRIANAQGLRNKLSEAYGYKNFAASQRALGKINSRSSKTVIGLQKRKYENQAYNNKAFAKYGDRMAKASTGEKIVESLFRTELMTTPIRSVYGGRKTTMAKEMVISSLTAGYGNMILDAGAIAKKEVATIRRKK